MEVEYESGVLQLTVDSRLVWADRDGGKKIFAVLPEQVQEVQEMMEEGASFEEITDFLGASTKALTLFLATLSATIFEAIKRCDLRINRRWCLGVTGSEADMRSLRASGNLQKILEAAFESGIEHFDIGVAAIPTYLHSLPEAFAS